MSSQEKAAFFEKKRDNKEKQEIVASFSEAERLKFN